jgi:hypothetical protein
MFLIGFSLNLAPPGIERCCRYGLLHQQRACQSQSKRRDDDIEMIFKSRYHIDAKMLFAVGEKVSVKENIE